jgi:hypothetical protein
MTAVTKFEMDGRRTEKNDSLLSMTPSMTPL